jgi:hypothetical protein
LAGCDQADTDACFRIGVFDYPVALNLLDDLAVSGGEGQPDQDRLADEAREVFTRRVAPPSARGRA